MSSHPEIARLVDATPFIDTHEHLVEESTRLAKPGKHWIPVQRFLSAHWYMQPAPDLRRDAVGGTNALWD